MIIVRKNHTLVIRVTKVVHVTKIKRNQKMIAANGANIMKIRDLSHVIVTKNMNLIAANIAEILTGVNAVNKRLNSQNIFAHQSLIAIKNIKLGVSWFFIKYLDKWKKASFFIKGRLFLSAQGRLFQPPFNSNIRIKIYICSNEAMCGKIIKNKIID
jgi:hypothetical protein